MFKKIKSLFSSKPAHGSNQHIAELIKQLPPSLKLDKETANMMGLSDAEKVVVDSVIELTFGTLAKAMNQHVAEQQVDVVVPATVEEAIQQSVKEIKENEFSETARAVQEMVQEQIEVQKTLSVTLGE